jgi:hypothetical protein
MVSKRQAPHSSADRDADDLIAQLRDLRGVVEIYSEYEPHWVIVTAFVESEAAETAATELEIEMARGRPNLAVELRVYVPTKQERAQYREVAGETLEWARDQ